MYDVIVIGGGPGGYAAGIRAAQLGGRVALLEPGEMGGTCVNRGCLPTKMWLKAARIKKTIESGETFGIKAGVQKIDFSKIVARKKGIPHDIGMGMNALCANNGIEVIHEKGRFKSPHEVEAGGKVLETRMVIIATGSSLSVPNTPDLEQAALTTDEAMELTEMPESILIVGDGPIEVEMATIFSAFDCAVTLVTPSPRILPGEDGDTGQRITKCLREQGVTIIPRSSLKSVSPSGEGFTALVVGQEEQVIPVRKVLVSSRRPNTDLGLEKAGVKTNSDGFIQIDDTLQTSAAGIYAIGDVTGGAMMSYGATAMGVTAAENAMGGSKTFNPRSVPRALYTFPEAASVGITEEEADELDLDVEIGNCPMSINGVAMSYGEVEGNVKVIADAALGQVLGVHIVGEHATEMIGGVAAALQLETTVEELAYMLCMHPTFSENIAMAAQDAMKWALYLPRQR
ncbi:dihydrolipoyl dehydrogenase [bacterium]|nr:dihydrolipoyl dehydrogenase [bacterium]